MGIAHLCVSLCLSLSLSLHVDPRMAIQSSKGMSTSVVVHGFKEYPAMV